MSEASIGDRSLYILSCHSKTNKEKELMQQRVKQNIIKVV